MGQSISGVKVRTFPQTHLGSFQRIPYQGREFLWILHPTGRISMFLEYILLYSDP